MSPRTIAVTGTLLASFAAPAAAHAAPTIAPLKPCYVTADIDPGPQVVPRSEGYAVSATGFTPNSTVNLTQDGVPVDDGQALQVDATGTLNVAGGFAAPFVRSGSHDFTITLTQTDNPAITASATAKSTALGVTVKPTSARPSQTIKFKGLGFTADKPVYAHYIRKGTLRKTVRMARHTGTCGAWKAHRPQFPFEPKTGVWKLQFDQKKKYSTNPGVFVTLRIRVSSIKF